MLPSHHRHTVTTLLVVASLLSLPALGQDSELDSMAATPFQLRLPPSWNPGLNGANAMRFQQGTTTPSAGQLRFTLDGRGASPGWLGSSTSYALVGLGRQPWQAHGDLLGDPLPRPGETLAYGIGHRTGINSSASLLTTHEESFGLSHRTTHALWQSYPRPSMQLTVDLFHRRGDSELVSGGLGIAATLDYRGFFLQFARDPNFNFTSSDMTSVSLGLRF